MVVVVDSANWDEQIVQSDRPVLVDFWGPRCVPCLRLMPQVETLAERLGNRVKVAKVDASANRRLCIRLKVLSLPTFLVFREGVEVKRLSGEPLSIQEIEAAVKELLGEGK
jgi:thioredoxin 1